MIKLINSLPENGNLVIPCFEDVKIILPENLKEAINNWIEIEKWEAKTGKNLELTIENYRVILMGLGKKEKFTTPKFRTKLAELARKNNKFAFVADNLELESELVRNIVEALVLSQYKFDNYKSKKEEKDEKKAEFSLITFENFEDEIKEGQILAEATIVARNLVNEPANVIYPESLAAFAEKAGEECGFQVEVFEEGKIKALKMEAYLSVARAAEKRPRFIIMRHLGDPDNKDNILGLVGKGLTYDTGGLSLKPSDGMVGMKSDMGGSAAVIGAMTAIAKMKLKKNVIAVVAACENSIGGNAYRPGDIIGSMAGKSIEVGNTDAEGRLTLIDAVHYIITKENVSKVVDIATLTGAVLVALGKERSGIVSNNDDFFNQLQDASINSGDKIWRLPHDDEYVELLKSPIADLNNIGGRLAGSVTAGLFIREFVQKKPWLHIDIAGTSFTAKPKGDTIKGATGAGTRLLYFLAKN